MPTAHIVNGRREFIVCRCSICVPTEGSPAWRLYESDVECWNWSPSDWARKGGRKERKRSGDAGPAAATS